MWDIKIENMACRHCEKPTDYIKFSMYRGYVPVCKGTDCLENFDKDIGKSLNQPPQVIVSPEFYKKLKDIENGK